MIKRGGARSGAGRKPNAVKLLEAGFVAEYFGLLEQEKIWKSILASGDDRIRLDAAKYLTDRLYGKPPQAVALSEDPERDIVRVIKCNL